MAMNTTKNTDEDYSDMTERAPLAGRHALITGGGKGIGAAIAESLAGLGTALTLVGRDQAALDTTRDSLRTLSDAPILSLVADVTDTNAVAAAFISTLRWLWIAPLGCPVVPEV